MSEITFLGDVYLPRPYHCKARFNNYIFNLEYPITSAKTGIEGKINLKSNFSHIEKTFGTLPIAVNLANNHTLDYGRVGLKETIEVLDNLGIDYFGSGSEDNNYNNPAIVDIGEHSVGLLGYVIDRMGEINTQLDEPALPIAAVERIKQDIRSLHEQVDRIVVQFHWGTEEVHLPRPQDIQLGHAVIEAGADLIIGHHAHAIQTWEMYEGKPIYYGLGNAVMPDLNSPSYYKKGESTKRFQKKQRWWNKKSISVNFDPVSNKTEVIPMKFNGTSLQISRNFRCRVRSMTFPFLRRAPTYPTVYRASHIYGKVRKYGMDFSEDPWIPSTSEINALWRTIRRNR